MAILEEIRELFTFGRLWVLKGVWRNINRRSGWVTDRTGYRYDPIDPLSGLPWPQIPDVFLRLATGAAAHAGFSNYVPDACLNNRYEPGARLLLHQDKNEEDFDQPIVSVSLGIPAVFCLAA